MSVPSVDRRNRRSLIERVRHGATRRQMFVVVVVIALWAIVFGFTGPEREVLLASIACGLALAFAIAARIAEPRDSIRWQVLAAISVAFLIPGFDLVETGELWGFGVFLGLLALVIWLIGPRRAPGGQSS